MIAPPHHFPVCNVNNRFNQNVEKRDKMGVAPYKCIYNSKNVIVEYLPCSFDVSVGQSEREKTSYASLSTHIIQTLKKYLSVL